MKRGPRKKRKPCGICDGAGTFVILATGAIIKCGVCGGSGFHKKKKKTP